MNAINTSVGKQIQTKNGRIAGVVACVPTHEISNDYFTEKEEKFPIFLEKCGNTVSSSIPLTLESMLNQSRLKRGDRLLLLGFGVGYSWAGAVVKF